MRSSTIVGFVALVLASSTALAGVTRSTTVDVGRGDTVRIAVATPLSGPLAPYGALVSNGVAMAIADHPRVKGFPVEQVDVDAPCSLPEDTEAATRIASDPTILGVVGPTCSEPAVEALPIYEAAGLVTVSPTATAANLGEDYAPTTFNRTAVAEPDFDAWYATVSSLPSDLAFWTDYETRYGVPPARLFADLAHDAALVLLDALKGASRIERGSLVVDRDALAAAVRATDGLHGVTCTIAFEDDGDRVASATALARCAAADD